jgi:hypothetical protein
MPKVRTLSRHESSSLRTSNSGPNTCLRMLLVDDAELAPGAPDLGEYLPRSQEQEEEHVERASRPHNPGRPRIALTRETPTSRPGDTPAEALVTPGHKPIGRWCGYELSLPAMKKRQLLSDPCIALPRLRLLSLSLSLSLSLFIVLARSSDHSSQQLLLLLIAFTCFLLLTITFARRSPSPSFHSVLP